MADRTWSTVGKNKVIKLSNEVIGEGLKSTIVRGSFDGKAVAVKIIATNKKKFEEEVEILQNVDHRNVIKYLYNDVSLEGNSMYIVLELCFCSLADYIEKGKASDVQFSMITGVEILKQITDGVNYLHNENTFCNVHRDLKPSNVLFLEKDSQIIVKISDFGISKYIPQDASSLTVTSPGGSRGYRAPELLEKKEGQSRIQKESDIFSLGIIFYYVLSQGKHPFGDDELMWDSNIRDSKNLSLSHLADYTDDVSTLIKSMLEKKCEDRPKIETIKSHHLFWEDQTKLDFFQVVSDYLEDRSKHNKFLNKFEKGLPEIAPEWREHLSKQSKAIAESIAKLSAKKKSLQDLIRLIRNWAHHYNDPKTSQEFRDEIGQLPNGLVSYFTSRFPKLLSYTYDQMKEHKNEKQLKKFYEYEINRPKPTNSSTPRKEFLPEDEVMENLQEDLLSLSMEEQQSLDDSVEKPSSLVLRSYQLELAAQALLGHNSMIIAPTGSGKTAVAMEIIKKHLRSGKSKSIIFLVSKTTLARQQHDFFSRHLKDHLDERIAFLIGENSSECSVGATIKTMKLVVLTPQILIDEMKKSRPFVTFDDISLLIFDECHNATKRHPYKIIMDMFLDYREQHGVEIDDKLQIIGMTASPGVGKGKDRDKVLDNLITLLANLNITIRPAVVWKHAKELKEHQNDIEENFIRIPVTEDAFTLKITKAMDLIEAKLKEMNAIGKRGELRDAPDSKDKQTYENWCVDVVTHAKLSDSGISRGAITYAEHLKMYHRLLYLNKHIPNAMERTDKMVNWEQKGKEISFLRKINDELHAEEAKMVDPPLMLKKLFEILQDQFKTQPASSCIIFVPRKVIAMKLVECIEEDPKLTALNPKFLTSAHSHAESGGMTKSVQENSLESFRKGGSKVLIATSVGEEGLDIRACNLVIMYNYVTGEVGRIQRAGRGRADNSRSILITSVDNDHIERERKNKICEVATNMAIQDLMQVPNPELKQRIATIQKSQWKERQKEKEEKKKLLEAASKYNILCGKCQKKITSADQMRQIKNTHKFVVDPNFQMHVRKKPWRGPPPEITPGVVGMGSYFCKDSTCGQQLGMEMQYRKKCYPTLTVNQLIFENNENGERKKSKQWNKLPFAIEKSIDDSDEEPPKPKENVKEDAKPLAKVRQSAENLTDEEIGELVYIFEEML